MSLQMALQLGIRRSSEHRCSRTLILTCILPQTQTCLLTYKHCTHSFPQRHTQSLVYTVHTYMHAHASSSTHLLDWLLGAAVTQYTGWEVQGTSVYCPTLLESRSPLLARLVSSEDSEGESAPGHSPWLVDGPLPLVFILSSLRVHAAPFIRT